MKPHKQVRLSLEDVSQLSTIRDVVRYAVTVFLKAGLHYGHGSSYAVDEAIFLVLQTLCVPLDDFDGFADARLTDHEKAELYECLRLRIRKRLPSAYITGRTQLTGLAFLSDQRALIPRSFLAEILFSSFFSGGEEGESLIEDPLSVRSVLDLCTGGGSLAIVASYVFLNAMIDACDISSEALALAEKNRSVHDREQRINLYEGNLYEPVSGKKYDLIISNPPYVAHHVMQTLPEEYKYEPSLALDGGEDGLDYVREIISGAAAHLNPGGGLLCEVGSGKEILCSDYPELPFVWLNTEKSFGEVFWLSSEDLK